MTLFDLLKTHEGAGNPATLFGHAQRNNTPFKGVDVSKMTLAQAKEFSEPSGAYGKWTRDELGRLGHRPRIATPMGIGQIVGTTLRQTQKELNLPDDVIFDEATQRRMIEHLASKRINVGDRAGTLKGLRQEWEGFKNVSDDDLWAAALQQAGQDESTFTPNRGKGVAGLTTFQQDMIDGSQIARNALENVGKEGPRQSTEQFSALAQAYRDRMPTAGADPLGLRDTQLGGTPAARSPIPGGSSHPLGGQADASPAAGSAPPGSPATSDGAASSTVPLRGSAGFPTGTPVSSPQDVVARAASDLEPVSEDDSAKTKNRKSLASRLAETLFPEAEDPKEKLRTAIGALSYGLGQMSHGQPVNLQGFFGQIAAQKQAAVDAQVAREKQQFENSIKLGNLQVAETNALTAQHRLEHDMAGESGSPFSIEQLEAFESDPALRPFVTMMAAGDKELRKQGAMGLRSELERRAEGTLGANPQLGDLYTAIASGDPTRIAEEAQISGVTPNELSSLLNAASPSDLSTLRENASQLVADGVASNMSEGMLMLNQALSGVNLDNELTKQQALYNLRLGQERYQEYSEAAAASSKLLAPVQAMRDITTQLVADDVKTGALTPFLGRLGSAVNSLTNVVGYESAASVSDVVSRFTGVTQDQFDALTESEKILSFQLARSVLKGQGTVTDQERTELAKTIASGNTTGSVRLNALASLNASIITDQVARDVFRNYASKDTKFSNIMGMEADMTSALREFQASYKEALTGRDALFVGDKGGINRPGARKLGEELTKYRADPNGPKDPPEELKNKVLRLSSPQLSDETARLLYKFLPRYGITHYVNDDGDLVEL